RSLPHWPEGSLGPPSTTSPSTVTYPRPTSPAPPDASRLEVNPRRNDPDPPSCHWVRFVIGPQPGLPADETNPMARWGVWVASQHFRDGKRRDPGNLRNLRRPVYRGRLESLPLPHL